MTPEPDPFDLAHSCDSRITPVKNLALHAKLWDASAKFWSGMGLVAAQTGRPDLIEEMVKQSQYSLAIARSFWAFAMKGILPKSMGEFREVINKHLREAGLGG